MAVRWIWGTCVACRGKGGLYKQAALAATCLLVILLPAPPLRQGQWVHLRGCCDHITSCMEHSVGPEIGEFPAEPYNIPDISLRG